MKTGRRGSVSLTREGGQKFPFYNDVICELSLSKIKFYKHFTRSQILNKIQFCQNLQKNN